MIGDKKMKTLIPPPSLITCLRRYSSPPKEKLKIHFFFFAFFPLQRFEIWTPHNYWRILNFLLLYYACIVLAFVSAYQILSFLFFFCCCVLNEEENINSATPPPPSSRNDDDPRRPSQFIENSEEYKRDQRIKKAYK